MRRIVVGFSGGVTSAWCLNYALHNFPREEVIPLFHDTKSEDEDTYRFLHEVADKLKVQIIEYSDGRSVEELENDNGALANNFMPFCSRILKAEQKDKCFEALRDMGITNIINVLGYSAHEWQRVQRATMRAERDKYGVLFPLILSNTSKQDTVDWVISLGIRPPRMYNWSQHANCVGCRRGGKAYWLAVKENRPDVFIRSAQRELDFNHTIINGCSLNTLAHEGLQRKVTMKEQIDISCDCGD